MGDGEKFVEQLKADGITEATVDVNSLKDSSKWKKYYRSKDFPEYGVLVAHPDSDCDLHCVVEKLEQEVTNYQLLSADGHNTPEIIGTHQVKDALGNSSSAILVVQHIDGIAPFKLRTEFRNLKKCVDRLHGEARIKVAESWERLRTAHKVRGVQDLQVMISHDGLIFVIDPERTATNPERTLPAWDEGLPRT